MPPDHAVTCTADMYGTKLCYNACCRCFENVYTEPCAKECLSVNARNCCKPPVTTVHLLQHFAHLQNPIRYQCSLPPLSHNKKKLVSVAHTCKTHAVCSSTATLPRTGRRMLHCLLHFSATPHCTRTYNSQAQDQRHNKSCKRTHSLECSFCISTATALLQKHATNINKIPQGSYLVVPAGTHTQTHRLL